MCASPRNSVRTGRVVAGLLTVGLLTGGALVSMAAQNTPAAPAPAAAKPVAKAQAAPVRPATGASGAVAPVKMSATAPVKKPAASVHPIAQLDDQVTYQYNALGRRDPFNPMIGGQFVGDDQGGDAPIDVGGMKVVGIVWGTSDKFALVEDARGASLVLRAGDKVMNGVVEGLKRDAVVVKLTVDGQTQSVAIPLTRKGDQSNANR